MLRTGYFAGIALLLGLLSFVIAASTGPSLTLGWAILAGAIAVLAVRLLTPAGETPHDLAPMLVAGSSAIVGGALKLAGTSQAAWQDAVAILAAVGAAWAGDVLMSPDTSAHCFVCRMPFEGAVPFACPRCRETICSRPSCWIARHFRCRYCDERDVILFPTDDTWWRTRLGPRVTEGSCASCYKEANETDLRACGRCQWPTCKRCWDHHNGQCSHCEWVLPDLPAALRPFFAGRGGGGAVAADARRQR